MVTKIRNESELKDWFENNFEELGYSKIIKKDNGTFPDFIMLRGNKKVQVELETASSNFILHGHDITKVDEVVCIEKDVDLDIPILKVKELEYHPRIRRISATVDERTGKLIDYILKKGNFRNKSHVIESSIQLLKDQIDKPKK